MSRAQPRVLVSSALVLGALLGLAGSFAPASARGVLWGLDGTLLVVGSAMLCIEHAGRGNSTASAGFLVYVVGQALILSCSAMDLDATVPFFAAGSALWAAGLALVSVSGIMAALIRVTGLIAALLFAVVAITIFLGHRLTPLSQPLPFFAYPFLVVTLFGWAWRHLTEER